MKARRQREILELIGREKIENQRDLAAMLKNAGLDVTQATISRDIKELGIIKIPCGKHLFRYILPADQPASRAEDRLGRLFRDSVVGVDLSENLIVIKTHPGGAQGVALAIDQAGWEEIIGTVGGDDTILVVIKPKQFAVSVQKRFENLLRG
ncbi:MAG: Arginine repressor [Pelotomaculum sp. PtaB.Bin104]|nr:MAG: Arginine repressor [Pelotomaculum sp. PtaB.Bin104]